MLVQRVAVARQADPLADPTGGRAGPPPLVVSVLPPAGPGHDAALAMLRGVYPLSAAFDCTVVGPPSAEERAGLPFRAAAQAWWQVSLRRRYAEAALETARRLGPAQVVVHDNLSVAALLAERMRPVPVVVILHSDPQAQRGWKAAPARTYLLAQATRVATASAAFRARLLEGVHASMRHCTLLPEWSGSNAARPAADALDALRHDALRAWSRTLDATI
jgi:hypothetical protein